MRIARFAQSEWKSLEIAPEQYGRKNDKNFAIHDIYLCSALPSNEGCR